MPHLEKRLDDYILRCSKISYGITYIKIRKLAFSYAKLLKCPYPKNWDNANMAGIDWPKNYMDRITISHLEN
ncbi:hypothetical protein NQ314_020888 [Rhamnusium bicolor]|uniref:Transposase n=1 Tax=Rhamnusium bicolor TaxID=1586634 RepID=A0AAV8WJ06_9CUCU|nr:hypothetical protein NQ314_020888 [Rhamnusium bicolor]